MLLFIVFALLLALHVQRNLLDLPFFHPELRLILRFFFPSPLQSDKMTMNVWRIAGDMSHLASFFFLISRLYKGRNANGGSVVPE